MPFALEGPLKVEQGAVPHEMPGRFVRAAKFIERHRGQAQESENPSERFVRICAEIFITDPVVRSMDREPLDSAMLASPNIGLFSQAEMAPRNAFCSRSSIVDR